MFPTRVLLAVDGSEPAERAAREAARLCSLTGSELHVVHVAPPPYIWASAEAYARPPESPEHAQEFEDYGLKEGRKLLDAQVEKIKGYGVEGVHPHLESGVTDASIVDLAENLGAGLLIVGNRGYGSVRRALMGSVSTSLLQHAHCPVLVVRHPHGEEDGSLSGNILVACDGSRESQRAAEAASELASISGANLHLAHVINVSRAVPYSGAYPHPGWTDNLRLAEEKADEMVEDLASRLKKRHGVQTVTHTLTGAPAVELVHLAESLETALVCMGSRGLGGIRRALLGSVSNDVAHHAPGSVLVIRREAADSAS